MKMLVAAVLISAGLSSLARGLPTLPDGAPQEHRLTVPLDHCHGDYAFHAQADGRIDGAGIAQAPSCRSDSEIIWSS